MERGSLEAAVPLNNNLASLEAQGIGTLKFYGQGAGALPTGNAVVQDLLDIAQGCKDTPPRTGGALQSDLSLLRARWWLRLSPEAAQRAKEELGAACESVRPRGEESVCLETAELPGAGLLCAAQPSAGARPKALCRALCVTRLSPPTSKRGRFFPCALPFPHTIRF